MNMREAKFLAYGVALTICVWAFPVKANFSCLPLKVKLHQLLTQGYGLLAAAEGPHGSAILVLLSENQKYTILGTDGQGSSCELLSGDSWAFFRGQGI